MYKMFTTYIVHLNFYTKQMTTRIYKNIVSTIFPNLILFNLSKKTPEVFRILNLSLAGFGKKLQI